MYTKFKLFFVEFYRLFCLWLKIRPLIIPPDDTSYVPRMENHDKIITFAPYYATYEFQSKEDLLPLSCAYYCNSTHLLCGKPGKDRVLIGQVTSEKIEKNGFSYYKVGVNIGNGN